MASDVYQRNVVSVVIDEAHCVDTWYVFFLLQKKVRGANRFKKNPCHLDEKIQKFRNKIRKILKKIENPKNP